MRAPLTQRTLFSLVLGLLLLSLAVEAAVTMRRCSSSSYTQLLGQLQSLAHLMKDTRCLLQPYIHAQGLNTPVLRGYCMECSKVFPSEDALKMLSRHGFLQTISNTLDGVLQGLATLQQKLLKVKDLPELRDTRQNIQGIKNNIYCMSELLTNHSETPEAPLPSPEATLMTLSKDIFQAKVEGCQFLCGYHHFMGSVEQVFGKWGDSLSRNRRESPCQVPHKAARMARPSSRIKRPVLRGKLS